MSKLIAEGGEFSCPYCPNKLKLTVTSSSSTGNSKKLANISNNLFLPPGGICSITQSPCNPATTLTNAGQSTVKIDGQTALGKGCEFQNPSEMSRQESVYFFSSGTPEEMCNALLSTALYDEDWQWAQDRCLDFLDHPNVQVKEIAIVCLGHIARIHQKLDLELVLPALKKQRDDPEFAGRVEDTLDDIQVFLHS